MASFKDLMKAFLYEDIDEEEDVVEEEVKPAAAPSAPVSQPAPAATVHLTEQAMPAPAEVLKTATASNIAPAQPVIQDVQTSIFEGLDMEDISRPEDEAPVKKSAYHYERRKVSQPARRASAGTGDDYQAVISPIFGNVSEDHKEFNAIHDAINLPKPEDGFEMTTIISPMYGNSVPAAAPVNSIPQYKVKKKKAAPEKEKEAVKETAVQTEEQPEEAQAPKKISSVADFLIKETVAAPKENKADEVQQESLATKK